MRKQLYRGKTTLLFLLIALISKQGNLIGQITVTGPTCIIPGITYQYMVNGNWTSSSTMRACVTGGKLSTGERCTLLGSISTTLFVVWSDTSFKKLELTSSLGNANLTPVATTVLKGGRITDKDKVQTYDSTVTNFTFHCEVARGGSCNSNYSYQWQKSDDGLNWTNINGAIDKNLQFSERIWVNTFFRRVTVEANSNTIAYSDAGVLTIVFN
jgi:hypothetical protein